MLIFRTHLLIGFELNVFISRIILTEDFQGILKLLELPIFYDDLNIHIA